MKSIIVGFAGKIGSGKTTISCAVAEALNWRYASFGAYVRCIALRRGLAESRKVLQEIGASLADNPDEFCRSVLDFVAWKPGMNLIVDGVRHTAIMDALRRVTEPFEVYLVFIRVDNAERMRRIAMQEKIAKREMSDHNAHSTEADAENVLPSMANIIIDGALPVSEIVSRIVAWLQEKISS